MTDDAYKAAEYIKQQLPGFKPRIALILGSGLSSVAQTMKDRTKISYTDLPGFPKVSVQGHNGQLSFGLINDVEVVCLEGRYHFYEGINSQFVKTYIRTLKLIGCEILFLTNAAGSLRSDVSPGNLMMITDHINLQGINPLIGKNEETFGPRFLGMDDAYDPKLQKVLRHAAETANIPLAEGVYISVLGPMFETPAEIRAFKQWGADAVGMSTVPEVIVARHCGLKVAAVSAITNFAAGMSNETLTHEGTLHHGERAAGKMSQLILNFLEQLEYAYPQ